MFTRTTISYLLLTTICLLTFELKAQFRVLNTGVEHDLHCVHFADANNGYVGGEEGAVLKTTNGGKHWMMLVTDTRETINDVFFLTADKGYAIGENGIFLFTSDGGVKWESVRDLYHADYTDIHFIDTLNGFAVGHSKDGGVFCKTKDGGKSWSFRLIDQDCDGNGLTPGIDCEDIYLTDIAFLDENRGLIGGFTYSFTYGKHPFICKTEDGGKTFRDISPSDQRDDWYNGKEVVSINYMNDNDACAIMNTGLGTDFLFISDYQIKSFQKLQLPSNFSSRGTFFSSLFLGRFIGYFTGIIDGEPQIIKTIDQGNTFMYLNPPTQNSLYASHFIDQNNGYFVGENGTILHLSDRTNIVYSAADQRSGYDPPYSIASLKRKNKVMQIQIYNLKRTNPKKFSISLYDSQGQVIEIKPRRVRIYSDEIRIRVRVKDMMKSTYFYSVSYSKRTVVNGKLNLSNYAHIIP
jgi:photosystem II stability/assembly factor-like uncharacterized protein